MERRQFLGIAGLTAAGITGCLDESGTGSSVTPTSQPTFKPVTGGPMNADELPPDDDPLDGYPPRFDLPSPHRTVDLSRFETMTVHPESFSTDDQNGVVVPLAPIDVAYYWYWKRTARFVDARARGGFENSHIFGAVSSPAPHGGEGDNPVADWPRDDRVVCYCGCPHHLSTMRAASLLDQGYEQIYVINEGFWEWHDRWYPLAGDNIANRPALRVINGLADIDHAGATAWAIHEPTEQVEAAPIGSDGGFKLRLHFADVTADSVVTVETPGYVVSGPLRKLTAEPMTG